MIKSDLAIIGSGPGGYTAAIRAAKLGLDTTVIEKEHSGGVCLNWGCIPTKLLYHLVQSIEELKKASSLGIKLASYEIDYTAAVKRKDSVVATLQKSIEFHFKKHNIRLVRGTAKLDSKGKIKTEEEEISAKYIIIATGSSPASVTSFDITQEGILTSREILSLKKIPASLAIIGGGIIGIEFANIFATLGSKVTIIEILPKILANEDSEVSSLISSSYKKRGIDIFTSTTIAKVGKKTSAFELKTDKSKTIEAEKVLVSVGRRPNTSGIGLEESGIKLDDRGYIKVDSYLTTSVDNIYAIGDAVGGYQLAHVASSEGKIAVDNILGKKKKISYSSVPYTVFTSPEIGRVGLTEEKAKESGRSIKVGKFPFTHNGKALIDGRTEGFAKIIADASTGEILGAHIIGPYASELIHEVSLAKSSELLIDDIVASIHSHPTLSESILEASEDVFELATHI